jgi:hypothetical protein
MTPPTSARGGRRTVALFAATLSVASLAPACHKKVSAKQCEEMLDRFIELSAKEQMPDASAEKKAQVRSDAKADEAFKNCTTEVQPKEYECAMRAPTSEAMLKCLE